ncbi:GumC family protein [Pelobium manganitolerans]|uniref:GumC family protein n=1 Tax=Pelobium manganitolerans TaxID=1842495 RepID=UPI003FA3AB3F
MVKQQPHITTLIIPEEKKPPLNIKVIVGKYLYHWPLFVLCLLFTLSAALVYLKLTKPTYEINATLIIKDEKKAPEQQSALSEIDLVNSSKLIENEIEVLKSNRLISNVVEKLNLEIIYQQKEGLNTQDLYKTGPVKLVMFNPTLPNQKQVRKAEKKIITIVIKDKNSFFLQGADKKLKEYSFNTFLNNSWGTWKLEPTDFLPEYKGATIQITSLDPEKVALQYQKAIEISIPNKLATAVSLTLEDPIAQRGKDILNQLIAEYNRLSIYENEKKAKTTLAFLDNRLDSLTAELNIAEQGIEGFKSSRGITDIDVESKINLEDIQQIERSLNEVDVKLSIIKDIEDYINSSKLGHAPATIGITDPALNNLVENLSRLQLQREKLLAVSPETNPDFDAIDRQIATTKTAIRGIVTNIKASLLSTRAKLQSYNNSLVASVKNIPSQERQLESIKRQQMVKEGLYTYLLQKREEIATNYSTLLTPDRVVDQAYASTPKDKKLVAMALAMVLGLGLPFTIIFLRNTLNETVTDVNEIKDVLETPIIGEISFAKSQDIIPLKSIKPSITSEQLRILRTNLYHLYGHKKTGKVTLVTSSVPNEGKSFISNNLALALCHIGRKTIILKTDLRKSSPKDVLNKNGLGITDFLNGKAILQEIINPSALNANLHVINSGTQADNPTELLDSEKLAGLINALQGIYDDIVIDGPSAHLVPDAQILARYTDATLYIIRQGYTEKTELSFIKELFDAEQLPNPQLIFNGIQKAKYGHGYNYKYGYYGKPGGQTIFTDFWKRF